MNQRTTYSEMFCFLAGGLAGAGLVWLYAPASGKAARKMIGRKLRDAAEGARELEDDLAARADQIQQEAAATRPWGEAEV